MVSEVRFGSTKLPEEQSEALHKATKLEWITIAYMVTAVVLVALVMGSSQAMKAAWIEDMLAFIPPIAFLVATRFIKWPPTPDHPYGYNRAVAAGHLVAASALLATGAILMFDSAIGLINQEYPPLGTMRLFGVMMWAGWPMIAVMVYTAVGPFILGRLKQKPAELLHDRILHADADMQKADWLTATGTILGVLGIGLGLWWADALVAIVISMAIVKDGWRNLHHALRGLMDGRARTTDMDDVHPLVGEVQGTLERDARVSSARVMVRDVGHLLSVDGFVVPRDELTASDMEGLVKQLRELDWKIDDVVLMPVTSLPDDIPDPRG